MKIETQFDVGDKVYVVRYCQVIDVVKKCEACEGTGTVVLKDGNTWTCPSCHGKGKFTWLSNYKYNVSGPFVVAQVRFTKVHAPDGPEVVSSIDYCFYDKGIIGVLFRQNQLFATKPEAEFNARAMNGDNK